MSAAANERPSRLEVLIGALPEEEAVLRAAAETNAKLALPSPDGDPAFDIAFSIAWKTTHPGPDHWRRLYQRVNRVRPKGEG